MKKKHVIWSVAILGVLLVCTMLALATRIDRYVDYKNFINNPNFAINATKPLLELDLTHHQPEPNFDIGFAAFHAPDGYRAAPNEHLNDPMMTYTDRESRWLKLTCEFHYIDGSKISWGKPSFETRHNFMVLYNSNRTPKSFFQHWKDTYQRFRTPPKRPYPVLPLDREEIRVPHGFAWQVEQYSTQPVLPGRVMSMSDHEYSKHVLTLISKQSLDNGSDAYRFETEHTQGIIIWGPAKSGSLIRMFDKTTGLQVICVFNKTHNEDTIKNFLGSFRFTLGDARTEDEFYHLALKAEAKRE